MNAGIKVKNLQKKFGDIQVFEDISLDVTEGEITAIIGPNGCGKSTLLHILAGATKANSGSCNIKDFNKHRLSYIFQNYRESLLPWRTNFNNLALPLELQGFEKQAIDSRYMELQALLGFSFDQQKYPYELSGGQQQILGFSRALMTKPNVLLIDEPFSALDYENNLRLREALQSYYLKERPTVLLVTHNIEEAVHLAHRIVVFSRKPSSVFGVVENTLPYPRNIETLKSEEFHHIKDNVLSLFQEATSV